MDPIGTVRRQDHKSEPGVSIWIRMNPSYPDNQFTDTEWTCIWSTANNWIGVRSGDDLIDFSEVIGTVPGTPAQTAADVQLGDRVETLPGALYWTDEPVQGVVVAIVSHPSAHCTILFDEPQAVTDPSEEKTTYTHWGVSRLHFRLLDEDEV